MCGVRGLGGVGTPGLRHSGCDWQIDYAALSQEATGAAGMLVRSRWITAASLHRWPGDSTWRLEIQAPARLTQTGRLGFVCQLACCPHSSNSSASGGDRQPAAIRVLVREHAASTQWALAALAFCLNFQRRSSAYRVLRTASALGLLGRTAVGRSAPPRSASHEHVALAHSQGYRCECPSGGPTAGQLRRPYANGAPPYLRSAELIAVCAVPGGARGSGLPQPLLPLLLRLLPCAAQLCTLHHTGGCMLATASAHPARRASRCLRSARRNAPA